MIITNVEQIYDLGDNKKSYRITFDYGDRVGDSLITYDHRSQDVFDKMGTLLDPHAFQVAIIRQAIHIHELKV